MMTYKTLLAIGLAAMLGACSQTETPEATAPDKPSVTEELKEKTAELAEAAKEAVKEEAETLKEEAAETMEAAKEATAEMTEKVVEEASEMTEAVARSNPSRPANSSSLPADASRQTATTSQPRSSDWRTRRLPILPAAPITATFIHADYSIIR